MHMSNKIIFIFLFLAASAAAQPVYLATGGHCAFFSSTPVEDISAVSENLNSVLNATTKEIQFKVAMTSFRFKKALMQEHFNEKYVESHKYPYAVFRGKINEDVDLTRDGTYDVTADGIFNVHGVDKQHTEKGKVTIKDGVVSLESSFKVALKDHNIEVPKIVVANISEVIDVTINCSYTPYKKEDKPK
jgi:hypothetical protein